MANITEFLAQVNKQGLARNNRWMVRVYPPRGLTATGNIISNAINKGGNKLAINLPILDAVDNISNSLSDLNLDLGPVSVGHNFNVPTLGYALSNMSDQMKALNLFVSSCALPGRGIEGVEHDIYGETRTIGVRHSHEAMSIQYYCSEDLREKVFFENWQDLIFNPQNKQRSYYDDYVSRVEVVKFDNNWKKQAVYRFHEAYPSGLSSIELTQDQGSLVQLAINFNYRYYEKVE